MIKTELIMMPTAVQDERGQSISLFVLVIMSALITTTGVVIVGAKMVPATSGA
jgi:hypothetical protein